MRKHGPSSETALLRKAGFSATWIGELHCRREFLNTARLFIPDLGSTSELAIWRKLTTDFPGT